MTKIARVSLLFNRLQQELCFYISILQPDCLFPAHAKQSIRLIVLAPGVNYYNLRSFGPLSCYKTLAFRDSPDKKTRPFL